MSGRGSPRRKLSCSVISGDLEPQVRPDRNPLYPAADPPASGRCPTARGPSARRRRPDGLRSYRPRRKLMEKRIFEALGGECEIYGFDLTAERLAEGESWVHEMHDRLTRFSPT